MRFHIFGFMLGEKVIRLHRKRTVIVNRKIPLGEGSNGLYGGMLYTRSVSVTRQSAVVRLPHSSLNNMDEDSIDRLIDESINKQVGDPDLDYDDRRFLPDKRCDDRYGNRDY